VTVADRVMRHARVSATSIEDLKEKKRQLSDFIADHVNSYIANLAHSIKRETKMI